MNYFDLHCDTIFEIRNQSTALNSNDLHISLEKARGIERYIQCFALLIRDEFRGKAALGEYKSLLAVFMKEMALNAAEVEFIRGKGEISRAGENGVCGAILTVEGGAVFAGDLNNIEKLAEDGVRMVTLTWNGENELGCGALCGGGALKPFGIEAVREMNRCGITVDVSHLCDDSLDDLLRRFDFPVAASHSNLRSACKNARNLTDERYCEIVKRGGIVGINLHSPFISDAKPEAEDLFRHTDRMLELCGGKGIAFGADFDGGAPPDFCGDISSIKPLYGLFERRYGKKLADAMFFDNAYGFFTR